MRSVPMHIALFYAMPSEIDSLIHGAAPMETVHGVSFYRIRPNVIACCGGVGKVNAAMAAALLIERYHNRTCISVKSVL